MDRATERERNDEAEVEMGETETEKQATETLQNVPTCVSQRSRGAPRPGP